MNLALVGPLPPASTGIADYTLTLLRHLRSHCDTMVAVVDRDARPGLSPGDVDAVYHYHPGDVSWWQSGHVVPLYQMGNHATYHRYVYELLAQVPGVTVLHDGNLLPFIHAITLERLSISGYVREVSFALRDNEGHRRAWHALRTGTPLDVSESRLLNRVIRGSLGVIVHNTYLRDYVLRLAPAANVVAIPLLDVTSPDCPGISKASARAELGFKAEDLLIGTMGFVAPSKRLDAVLVALCGLAPAFPTLRLICVGEIVPGYEIQARVDELGLSDRVLFTGYVSENQLELYLGAIDVGVNLRYPAWGESSAALLRLMAAGQPTLVTDAGGFTDLPDDVVLKIPVGQEETDVLAEALARLLQDPDRRAAFGFRAQAYVRRERAPAIIAAKYADFIKRTLHGSACGVYAEPSSVKLSAHAAQETTV